MNRILSITRSIIPYVPQLRKLPLVKTIGAAILMQQLDYWFEKKPDGFYKFLKPCDNDKYRNGDSWTEELQFSPFEFRNAFTSFGVAYKSKNLYDKAVDKFKGKYYCSYYDNTTHLTYYYRNHKLVDQLLNQLIFCPSADQENESPQINTPCLADQENRSLQIKNVDLPSIYTDNTNTEITYSKKERENARDAESARVSAILNGEQGNVKKSSEKKINSQENSKKSALTAKKDLINSATSENEIKSKESSACNTLVTRTELRNKRSYELKAKDFKWLAESYLRYKPESWSSDVPPLSSRTLKDLREAYEAVDEDMGKLKDSFEKALQYVCTNLQLVTLSVYWLISEGKFLEIAHISSNQEVPSPTKKLQQKIDSYQETADIVSAVMNQIK